MCFSVCVKVRVGLECLSIHDRGYFVINVFALYDGKWKNKLNLKWIKWTVNGQCKMSFCVCGLNFYICSPVFYYVHLWLQYEISFSVLMHYLASISTVRYVPTMWHVVSPLFRCLSSLLIVIKIENSGILDLSLKPKLMFF